MITALGGLQAPREGTDSCLLKYFMSFIFFLLLFLKGNQRDRKDKERGGHPLLAFKKHALLSAGAPGCANRLHATLLLLSPRL